MISGQSWCGTWNSNLESYLICIHIMKEYVIIWIWIQYEQNFRNILRWKQNVKWNFFGQNKTIKKNPVYKSLFLIMSACNKINQNFKILFPHWSKFYWFLEPDMMSKRYFQTLETIRNWRNFNYDIWKIHNQFYHHSSYRKNINHDKCAGMGLYGFILKKIKFIV